MTKHFLELELGANMVGYEKRSEDFNFFFAPSAALQYRYEQPNGFLLRAGLAPVLMSIEQEGSTNNQGELRLYPGVSLVYAF